MAVKIARTRTQNRTRKHTGIKAEIKEETNGAKIVENL